MFLRLALLKVCRSSKHSLGVGGRCGHDFTGAKCSALENSGGAAPAPSVQRFRIRGQSEAHVQDVTSII